MHDSLVLKELKIDRSKFVQRHVANFHGKYYYAMSLVIGNDEDGRTPRQTGFDSVGNPSWIYRSGAQALKAFNWHQPGAWYDYPQGEKILGVLLVREDGKIWKKGVFQQ